MPDDLLGHVEQLAVEFHWREDPVLGWAHDRRYLAAVERLRQFFEVGHIHFNNKACVGDLAPFPAYAFEVLFVSKRLAVVDASTPPVRPNPLDSRTGWWLPDCQIQSGL